MRFRKPSQRKCSRTSTSSDRHSRKRGGRQRQGISRRAQFEAILAKATDAMKRVAAAEKKLQDAIDAILTPEQKVKPCLPPPNR
jgi:hypothetical protein